MVLRSTLAHYAGGREVAITGGGVGWEYVGHVEVKQAIAELTFSAETGSRGLVIMVASIRGVSELVQEDVSEIDVLNDAKECDCMFDGHKWILTRWAIRCECRKSSPFGQPLKMKNNGQVQADWRTYMKSIFYKTQDFPNTTKFREVGIVTPAAKRRSTEKDS